MIKPYWSVEWHTSENTTESRMQNANERKTTQQRVVRAVSFKPIATNVRARIVFFSSFVYAFDEFYLLFVVAVVVVVYFVSIPFCLAMVFYFFLSCGFVECDDAYAIQMKSTAKICERARQSSHPMPLTTCRIATECTWIDDKSAKVFFLLLFHVKNAFFPSASVCVLDLLVNRFFPILIREKLRRGAEQRRGKMKKKTMFHCYSWKVIC